MDFMKEIISDRNVIFIFDRGFADEKLIKYVECFSSNYIMLIPKNCGIIGMEYKVKLSDYEHFRYFRDMFYHIKEKIKVNLFISGGLSDDPFFVVSNVDDVLECFTASECI